MTSSVIVPRRWRAPAPEPADIVRWPADFGQRFAIFVDTEEAFDWSAPFSRTDFDLSSFAAIPDAHARFAAREIGITYMVDYPVAADRAAGEILRGTLADGRSAIGAQMHAWVNPPFDEPLSVTASFAGNLPRALEAAKLDRLTDAIAEAFGIRPIAFRAGRYGLGPDSFDLLSSRGYRLDVSARARFRYVAEGGPDFSAIGPHGFWVDDARRLLELPPTTIFTGAARGGAMRLYDALGVIPRLRGVFARTGLLSRVPLTPEGVPVADALEAVRIALGQGVRVLNFAFHSPSLVPGNTPYVRDADDLARMRQWWDAVLDLLDRRGARPATLADLIAGARQGS